MREKMVTATNLDIVRIESFGENKAFTTPAKVWLEWKQIAEQSREEPSQTSCGACKFFRKHKNGDTGNCHRYPPVSYNAIDTWFPQVYHDYWCGEFLKKDV